MDPLETQVQDLGKRANDQRFGQPRHTHQQTMPARKQADQQQPDDLFLADNDFVEFLGDAAIKLADLLGEISFMALPIFVTFADCSDCGTHACLT